MNRSYFRLNLILLVAIVALLHGASSPGIAADAASTVSGRVVDGGWESNYRSLNRGSAI